MLMEDGVRPRPTAMLERRVRDAGVDSQRDGDRIAGEVADPRLGHGEVVDGGLTRARVARPPAVESGWQGLVLGPGSVGGVPEVSKIGVVHISRGYAATAAESARLRDVQVMAFIGLLIGAELGSEGTTAKHGGLSEWTHGFDRVALYRWFRCVDRGASSIAALVGAR